MKQITCKILSVCLLACCVGAVGILRGYQANAEMLLNEEGITRFCLGDMDFDFRDSNAAKSIWMGEHDGLKLKGCSHPIYPFESAMPGTRYVVASINGGQSSVVAYVNAAPASTTMTSVINQFQRHGYQRLRTSAVPGNAENYELFMDGDDRLQVISVPLSQFQSLLIVVRTGGRGRTEAQG